MPLSDDLIWSGMKPLTAEQEEELRRRLMAAAPLDDEVVAIVVAMEAAVSDDDIEDGLHTSEDESDSSLDDEIVHKRALQICRKSANKKAFGPGDSETREPLPIPEDIIESLVADERELTSELAYGKDMYISYLRSPMTNPKFVADIYYCGKLVNTSIKLIHLVLAFIREAKEASGSFLGNNLNVDTDDKFKEMLDLLGIEYDGEGIDWIPDDPNSTSTLKSKKKNKKKKGNSHGKRSSKGKKIVNLNAMKNTIFCTDCPDDLPRTLDYNIVAMAKKLKEVIDSELPAICSTLSQERINAHKHALDQTTLEINQCIDKVKQSMKAGDCQRENVYASLRASIDELKDATEVREAYLDSLDSKLEALEERRDTLEALKGPDDTATTELRNKYKLAAKRYYEVAKEYNDLKDATKREKQSLTDHITTATKECLAMSKEFDKYLAMADEKNSQIEICDAKIESETAAYHAELEQLTAAAKQSEAGLLKALKQQEEIRLLMAMQNEESDQEPVPKSSPAQFPIGVIPPHYISASTGTWTPPPSQKSYDFDLIHDTNDIENDDSDDSDDIDDDDTTTLLEEESSTCHFELDLLLNAVKRGELGSFLDCYEKEQLRRVMDMSTSKDTQKTASVTSEVELERVTVQFPIGVIPPHYIRDDATGAWTPPPSDKSFDFAHFQDMNNADNNSIEDDNMAADDSNQFSPSTFTTDAFTY